MEAGDTCGYPCPAQMTSSGLPPTFPSQSGCYVNTHHHPTHHSLTLPGCGCYANSLLVASTPRRKRLEGLPWKPCCPEASTELGSSPPFFPPALKLRQPLDVPCSIPHSIPMALLAPAATASPTQLAAASPGCAGLT